MIRAQSLARERAAILHYPLEVGGGDHNEVQQHIQLGLRTSMSLEWVKPENYRT